MYTDTMNSNNSNITKAELKRLSDLLENYDIVPDTATKQGDLFFIEAKSKLYCLKKIRDNHKRVLAGIKLREYLIQNGFNNIHENIKTKDGRDLLKYSGSYFFLTDFEAGKRASCSNFDDVKNTALLLARFHIRSQGFYNKYIKVEYKSYNWSVKEEKYKRVFGIIKEYIKSKRIKTMFDVLYMDSIEFFEGQLELAVKLCNDTGYDKILRNSQLKGTLCLDNFKFRNIRVSEEEEYYFNDLDNIKYNMIVFDLYKFLKKILNRKEYNWDFEYAREIIDDYCTVNPLSRDELTILLTLLIFPKQFYKLGRKRYLRKKKWDENRYLSRLFKITAHIDKQRYFVDEYLACYLSRSTDSI